MKIKAEHKTDAKNQFLGIEKSVQSAQTENVALQALQVLRKKASATNFDSTEKAIRLLIKNNCFDSQDNDFFIDYINKNT